MWKMDGREGQLYTNIMYVRVAIHSSLVISPRRFMIVLTRVYPIKKGRYYRNL